MSSVEPVSAASTKQNYKITSLLTIPLISVRAEKEDQSPRWPLIQMHGPRTSQRSNSDDTANSKLSLQRYLERQSLRQISPINAFAASLVSLLHTISLGVTVLGTSSMTCVIGTARSSTPNLSKHSS